MESSNRQRVRTVAGTGDALAQGRSCPQPFGQPEAFMKQQVPRAASPLAPKQEYTGNPGGYHPNLEPVSGSFVKAAPHNMQAIDHHTSQAPRSWTPTKVFTANSPARMTANQALEQEMNELAAIEAASTATITTNRGSPQLGKPAVAAAGRSDSPSWFKKGSYNSAFEEPAADGQNSMAGSPAQPFIAQHNNLMPGDGVSAHGSRPGSSGSSTGGIGKLKDRLGVGGGSGDHSGNRVHAFREPVDSGNIATASSGGSGSLQGSAAGRSPARGARFSNGHVTSSCRTPTEWQSQVSSQLAAGNRLPALELPGPSIGIIQCYIKRTAGLLGMAPSFELRVEATDELLAVARKRKKSAKSSYLISMEGNAASIKRADDQLVGKLKANMMGTEYTLRGKGGDANVHKGFNAQLLAVNYKGSIGQLKDSGPRTISATLPLPESQVWSGNASTGSQYDDLGVCLEAARHRELPMNMERDLMMMHTIKPHYDSVKQAHFLDFKGRVTKPSLKNFQLVHWDHNTNQTGTDLVMMFGKKGHDEYVMDFCYPLNTLQAFGLALSSIDSKLCYAI